MSRPHQMLQRHVISLALLGMACTISLPIPVDAAPELPQVAIDGLYQKSCVAAGLKYIDGVYSIRSADFRFVGRSRFLSDGALRSSLETHFSRALRVRERKKITEFKILSPSHIRCVIKDTLEIVMAATLPKPPAVHVYECNCVDEWKMTEGKWELFSTEQTQTSHSVHPESGTSSVPDSTKSASDE